MCGTVLPVAGSGREGQPSAQLIGGFIGGLAIKGHQSGRSARNARDLRPPLVASDVGNLDEVVAAVDVFFEAMHVHDSCASKAERSNKASEAKSILAGVASASSEGTREDASTSGDASDLFQFLMRKKLRVSFDPQAIHDRSTAFPQRVATTT